MNKDIFISTSIPYVNADPHIGFLLEALEADVFSRFRRNLGNGVYFLSGTDDNALKNVQSAEKLNIPVRDLVDINAKKFIDLLKGFDISNDDFIRTSSDKRHILGAQKLWSACKKTDIYKKRYEGFYCIGCEAFKTEKDLIKGNCSLHPGKELQKVEEENYFFKLSNYQDKLLSLIEKDEVRIIPEEKKNEIVNFIKSGLEDFSISRSAGRAKNWGIKVPGDESQIMYVWFDALSNYINALGYADDLDVFKKFWKNGYKIHIVGKDINRFHTVYWPAMLLSAGIELPNVVFVHGFINDENGQKMSKTLGNYINPFDLLNKYGKDPVRYFLLKEGAHYSDSNFSIKFFEEKYNSDLANGLGNFAARVSTLAEQLGNFKEDVLDEDVKQKIGIYTGDVKYRSIGKVDEFLGEFKISEAMEKIWQLISFGDSYINAKKPWDKKISESERIKIIYNGIKILEDVSRLLIPFLPDTADKILKSIIKKDKTLRVSKVSNLFPKIN